MTAWDDHEFAPAGGTRMHAARIGPSNAPTVVCVPGLGCSFRYFAPLASELAPEFQAFAVDLPGFGRSPGPPKALDVRGMSAALGDWLRATGRERSILVGDSTGCQAIIDLAVTDPDLLGPVVLGGPVFDRRLRTVPHQVFGMARNLWADRNAGMGLAWIRLQERRDSGLRRWLRTFLLCLHDPIERKVGHIRTPAAVVRGEMDPLVSPEWAADLAGMMPRGRLMTAEGSGHTTNYVRPDVIAAAVRQVAAEWAAGGSPAASQRPVVTASA